MNKDERDNLESFAKRIETRIKEGLRGSDSMERLLCRLMTGKDKKVASMLGAKWVEWRYGRAKETLEVLGSIEHEHRIAIDNLTDAELAQVEQLIESANARTNPG